MPYILETSRLRLREASLADTSFILALLNSPGWLQYIGDRQVHTAAQAAAYLQNGPLNSYAELGFGLWLVEQRDSQQLIGMCGLLQREYLENPDIGFAFLPACQGKGYALEAASATMAYAREQLQLQKILAIVQPDNERSIRLLERIGLSFRRMIALPGSEVALLLFSN